MKSTSFAAFLLTVGVLTTGCSTLSVKSTPPGARIMWSPDGARDFKEWPPSSWQYAGRTGEKALTPFMASGAFGDTIFVTVEKEGYRSPLPKPVQLYTFRHERLAFTLTELPETAAARKRAEGLLFYKGEWVRPADFGIVEVDGVVMTKDEAFRRERLALGLVEYDGQWMKPDEAAAKRREQNLALGLVEHKTRWVKTEIIELEKSIDAEVASIAASKTYADLPAPRPIANVGGTDAQLQIFNSTGNKIRFLISGPESRIIEVMPYRSMGVRLSERVILPAGRYDLAVIPTTTDAIGKDLVAEVGSANEVSGVGSKLLVMWGSWPLAPGMQVSINYTGTAGNFADSLREFQDPKVNLDIKIPDITVPEVAPPPAEKPAEGERPRQGNRPTGSGGGGGGGGRRSAP